MPALSVEPVGQARGDRLLRRYIVRFEHGIAPHRGTQTMLQAVMFRALDEHQLDCLGEVFHRQLELKGKTSLIVRFGERLPERSRLTYQAKPVGIRVRKKKPGVA